ncbi:MAG TPA: hypothetical protein VLV46_00265 [Gaiellaceae bacterium]|nr:hypothetical protein [Gaiellaceae bacterium]
MRRLAVGLVLALAVVVAPSAGGAGSPISYTITAGTPGDNGWYTTPVTVHISVDSTVTNSDCPVAKTFNTSSDSLNCTATDNQGGNWQLSLQFKIDSTPPTVTSASVDRPADSNGWYNHPVTITFVGSDSGSGIASCTSVGYSGPDSATATVSGTCKDNAGNTSSPGAFQIKYDSTPPAVTASPARAADGDGWYSHAVQVNFTGTDSLSGIASCSAPATYSGPDSASAAVSGTCTDQAGNKGSATATIHYDSTGPKVSVDLARKPDANGWYTKPVVAKFSGTDSVSGIASCSAPETFKGPDGSDEKVTGTCKDKAGNTGTGSVDVRYDGSGPRLAKVAAAVGDRSATLSWKRPADLKTVEIVRRPGRASAKPSVVYQGNGSAFQDKNLRVGVAYRYTLTSKDAAGNTATVSVTATPRALYAPAPGAKVGAGAVKLAWVASKGARYYNVQLFRGGKKVLSTWPLTSTLEVKSHWSYAGKTYKLAPGTYHWYVWPGVGPRSASRYGALLGGSTFVVR